MRSKLKGMVLESRGRPLLVCLLAALALLATGSPAVAGRLVATGHDADLHCHFGLQCHFFKVAVDYVRAGSPKPVLVLDRSDGDVSAALDAAFPPAGSVPRKVVDPRSAADFGSLPITVADYSAVIIASDVTCGGCDLNEFGSTPDSDAINVRAAVLKSFFNAGGGIFALAGAEHGNGSAPDDVYYSFLPLPVGGVSVKAPFKLTPEGIALGLQDAVNGVGTNDDINCCATHNSFAEPPTGSAIKVAERDANDAPETIFAEGTVDGDTITACAQTVGEEILCAGDGTGDFIYKFRIKNLFSGPAYHLFLLDLPAGVTATPNSLSFAGEPGGFLAKDATSGVQQVRIHGAHAGDVLGFRFSLHNADFAECCAIPHEIVLPRCGCAQVLSEGTSCRFTGVSPGFDYTFTIQNLAPPPNVEYVLVSPSPSTPGIFVSQSTSPISPPLATGDKKTLTVHLSGPGAHTGATACFLISTHDRALNQCCAIERCVTLPSRCFTIIDWDFDPLGSASVIFRETGALVQGIGTSGNDGVRIGFPPAESFRAHWQPLDADGPLPDGSLLRFGATGSVAGAAHDLGELRITDVGPALEITADYSVIGSTTQRVEVYRDGVLVTAVSGHQGPVARVQTWPTSCGKGKVILDGGTTACYNPGWDDGIQIQILGGPTVVGDSLKVLAEHPAGELESLDSFSIRAAGVSSILIDGLVGAFDCNLNGVPDSDDIARGTSFDFNGNGIPDECDGGPANLDLVLNTGFDQATGTLLPLGKLPKGTPDLDWTVPFATVPLPAKVVIGPIAAWHAALPDSRWISVDANHGNSPARKLITYSNCFCIGPKATSASLSAQLFADDQATVFLNGTKIAGPGGPFFASSPLTVDVTGVVGPGGPFHAGENCLQVEVDDFGRINTGFDLVGRVRAAKGVCP